LVRQEAQVTIIGIPPRWFFDIMMKGIGKIKNKISRWLKDPDAVVLPRTTASAIGW
jgi:hypothetical protein